MVDLPHEQRLYVARMKDQPGTAPAPKEITADRIELLHTFVRIVEAGSLSAAAAQLGTTQPTVSRRLQSLERFLGVRLLQRSTHEMRLTEDGERCFNWARTLVSDWATFEESLRGVAHEPEGTLRVRVPHAFGQQMLIGPLAEYLRRYEKMSVEWLLDDQHPEFIADAIDCAIRVGEVHDPSVVAIRLGWVPRSVVVSPTLLAGMPPIRRPEDLERLPWLSMRQFYRNALTLVHAATGERREITIRPRMSTDSLYALRSATIAGLGAGAGSSWLFLDDIARGDLVEPLPDWQADPLPIYLIYPHARFYPARLRRFVDIVRQATADFLAQVAAAPPAHTA